jgi:hypothetical protein
MIAWGQIIWGGPAELEELSRAAAVTRSRAFLKAFHDIPGMNDLGRASFSPADEFHRPR